MEESRVVRVVMMGDARLVDALRATSLGRDSCEIRLADAGEDLPRLVARFEADAVLMGGGEACVDVLETCRRLRAGRETADTPIVVVGLPFDEARARAAGATAFIPSPPKLGELRDALAGAVGLTVRHARRVRVSLGARYASSASSFSGRCLDLSSSGAFLTFDEHPPVGFRGELSIKPESQTLSLTSEVVRVGRGATAAEGAGVRFVDLAPDTRAYLSHFVLTLSSSVETRGAAS
jgi:CheY-like chemotaxis protein